MTPRSAPTGMPDSTLRLVRGPSPFTLRSRWNSARSRGSANPNSSMASSRTSVWISTRTLAPAGGRSLNVWSETWTR
jgi:hypothetical protein